MGYRIDRKRLKTERLSKAKRVLSDQNLDAMLFTTWDNVRYVTDSRTVISAEWCSLLTAVLTREGEMGVFGPFREEHDYQSLQAEGAWSNFPLGGNAINPIKWARTYASLLRSFGKRSGRIGLDSMEFQILRHLQNELPKCVFVDGFGPMLEARAVKGKEEIKALAISAKIVDEGISAGINSIRSGVRENEIYAKSASAMIELGSEGEPFGQMLSSGTRSTDHIFPSSKKIRDGEFIMMDIGCFANGYAGDITRTSYVGHLDARSKEYYSSLHQSYSEGIKLIRAGKKTWMIDHEMRKILREFNCPVGKTGLGHGIGMRSIELPVLADREDSFESRLDTLKTGMVITLEPKTSRKGFGTIGLEDMILVNDNGSTLLTNSGY
jgi:Xaa-Pro aminopeptidase